MHAGTGVAKSAQIAHRPQDLSRWTVRSRAGGGRARWHGQWKRGLGSQGLKQAVDYSLGGSCDATVGTPAGVARALGYAPESVTRFIVEDERITSDQLDRQQLAAWVTGRDPDTEVMRGALNPSPRADLLLDATINASKSFSIAAILDPEIAAAYDALQNRLRERIILAWQRELNGRRGKAGCVRMPLTRIEIVELRHARSRALDPHQHRHLRRGHRHHARGPDLLANRAAHPDSPQVSSSQDILPPQHALAPVGPKPLGKAAIGGLGLNQI